MDTKKDDSIREWGADEKANFMRMIKKGKSIAEISKKLGRTIDELFDEIQRILIIKLPELKGADELITVHDKCKAMASAARQVARANGKRITMSMFYVEDL